MSGSDLPKLNKHGQEIWFKEAVGESGFAPVHRKGWIALLIGFVWISFSAGVGMVFVVLWAFRYVDLDTAIVVPFIILVPGMWRLGSTVRRHS